MSKKKIIMISVGVAILFIINIVAIILSVYKPNNYWSNVNNDEKQMVLEIFDNISFSDELKENLSAKEIYNEFTNLKQQNYKNESYEFINKSDKVLKNTGTSFVEKYNEGNSFEEILNETLGDEYKNFTNRYLLGNDSNEEYPKESVEKTYYSMLTKCESLEYETILKNMDEILDKYKFTEAYDEKLANLYHDVQILNTDTNLSDIEILETLYDPSVYIIQSMLLFMDDRYEIIQDKNSPALYETNAIKITNVENLKINKNSENFKELYDTMYRIYLGKDSNDFMDLYKITFTVEDNNFEGYIIKTSDKNCHFYSFKSIDNSNFESLADVKINKNNQSEEEGVNN